MSCDLKLHMLHHYVRQADIELSRLLASQQALLEQKEAGSRLVELLDREMVKNRETEVKLLQCYGEELKKLPEECADEPVNIRQERKALEEYKEIVEEMTDKGEQLQSYVVEERRRMQVTLQQLADTSEAISVAQSASAEAKRLEAEYRVQLQAHEDAEAASER
ncbi:hypothetical protein LTR48_002640 [Friedmanniomyces endolithicus]|uniref:Uncharacterized protein n=1 Tax=Rachicladosporium monterosium TaxID=1507873 RepID=A0ABR0LAD1_9PEZI|nr:hypothetical protein LTR29_004522 [Friedmanniomyces endolithicus]KAK1093285.1 hypothetical protein LTR48_002640 [Friedmanniomyces endolithicus]KAK5145894.1 hypothetical protein LTR32_002429 [Rachicladosporium monterosium]